MVIAFENPPPKSLETLEEGLAGLGLTIPADAAFYQLNKLIGALSENFKKMAHQVYGLRLDQLAESGPLEKAELLSWRYIVNPAIDAIVSADVRVGASEKHIFSELGLNRIASTTLMQLTDLAKDKNLLAQLFHPRLLRVFGLRFAALWLHQSGAEDFKNDIFIPLAGASSSLIAGRKYSGDELAAELHKKAAEQIRLVSETSS